MVFAKADTAEQHLTAVAFGREQDAVGGVSAVGADLVDVAAPMASDVEPVHPESFMAAKDVVAVIAGKPPVGEELAHRAAPGDG